MKNHVEFTRGLVLTCEENLASAQKAVSACEAQLKAYEQVRSQVAAAASASLASAENKVTAAKAELAEHEAVLEQIQADFDRQKELSDQGLSSLQEYQEAERKLKAAIAKVARFQAFVQAAENDVVVRQNEEKSKEQKAQFDIDSVNDSLNKAKGDVAKAESDSTRSKLDLQKAEKDVVELEIQLTRQTRRLIQAPFSGFVTKLTGPSLLKEGDTICLIWPESTEPVPVADSSKSPTWQDSGTLGTVSTIGRRFREIRTRLKVAEETKATQSSVAKIKEDLAAVESERETAVEILGGQLHATRKLLESRSTLRDMLQRQVETGLLDPSSLAPAEQAVVTTTAEIRELEVLLDYCSNLGGDAIVQPEADQTMARAVLEVRLEAAGRQRLNFQTAQVEIARRRFESGDGDIRDVLNAEQAEATIAAEVQKIEALLRYYEKLGINEAQPKEQGTASPSKRPDEPDRWHLSSAPPCDSNSPDCHSQSSTSTAMLSTSRSTRNAFLEL